MAVFELDNVRRLLRLLCLIRRHCRGSPCYFDGYFGFLEGGERMIILPSTLIVFQGGYITYVFLAMFVFALVFALISSRR